MAPATVQPDFQTPQTPPGAAGQPEASLIPQEPASHKPQENEVTHFDHLAAYYRLRDVKDDTRKRYSNKISEYLDAREVQDDTLELLGVSRVKPKRYRRVQLSRKHWSAPEFREEMNAWLEESVDAERGEMHDEIGDAEIYEDEEGLQGTFWVGCSAGLIQRG